MPSSVNLAVYDAAGRKVRVLADRRFDAGEGRVVWDGRDDGGKPLSSGIYFVRMVSSGETDARKVVLLK